MQPKHPWTAPCCLVSALRERLTSRSAPQTKSLFVVGEHDAAMAMNYMQPTLDVMPNAAAVTVSGGHFAPMSNDDGAMVKAINAFFA